MGLTITERTMRSPDTEHTVRPAGEGWEVSWLPGRVLSQSQAVTAMTIAEEVGRGVGLSDDPQWPHLEDLAAELGLSGARAVVLASEPPASEPG